MNTRKTSFKVILILIAILATGVISGFIIQHILNDKIKDLFVREINKYLSAPVEVKDIKLSLFRDFPSASVRFTGVSLKEAIPQSKKGDLLTADIIALRFGLLDLLKNRFTVSSLLIKNSTISLRTFQDGSNNYNFWKSSAGSNSSEFTIDLHKIEVQETSVFYLDAASGQDMRFRIGDALVKGSFSKSFYQLSASADLKIELLALNQTVYLKEQNAGMKVSLDINNKEGLYKIQNGELHFGDLALSTTGWIINRDNRKELDMSVFSDGSTLSELISALPESYRKYFDDYRLNGDANLTLGLKGNYGGSSVPAISAKLTLAAGSIGKKNSRVNLEQVELVATYTSGQDMKNETLILRNIQAKLKNGTLAGSLSMQGLKASYIKADLKANLDLGDFYNLLNLDTLKSVSGQANFKGYFEGRISDIQRVTNDDISRCRLSGSLLLSGTEAEIRGYSFPVRGVEGEMMLANNSLQLKRLHFNYGKSDFTLKGYVQNLLGYLLIKNQKITLTGDMHSGRLDWDQVSESTGESEDYSFGLPDDIEIQKFHVNVRDFSFRKFHASSISADLSMRNRILSATNILMQSMKGVVNGQGSINASNPSYSIIQCKATLNKVNIKSLFEEFGNFGNTDLTSDNLDGSVSADVIYASTMYPNLEMDLESIKAHADIRVENGRLVNYEPMKGLSNFLRVEDLADIRFEMMENQIDIANHIIYIPVMQIKSSAIDLNLMGTHTFNNEINYHFNLALADLIAAKFKKRNPTRDTQSEFGPIEEDDRGKTRVYVSMTGTVDDPVFSYDKKAVREKLSDEIKSQKAELKELLKKEFVGPGDSLRKARKANEQKIMKKQEEGKFIFEWDEDEK